MKRRTLFKTSLFGALGAAGSSLLAGRAAYAADAAPALPKAALDEVTPTAEHPVLLNFNENSLGMSEKAKAAVAAQMETAFRYPDAVRSQVIEDIAGLWGLKSENVALGNGSSEILQAVIEAQVNKARLAGKKVQLLEPVPTFGTAAAYAESLGIPVNDVPVDMKTFKSDVPALKKAAEAFDGVSILYFCNPNNPTSCVSPASEINAWIEEAAAKKAPVFFLMDEAYADFVTDPAFTSAIELVKKGLDNVVVARTFSKLYAMAGLRLGYGIGTKAAAAETNAFCSIDNTNFAAAVAGSASLKDKAYIEMSLESIKLSRAIVTKAFDEMGIAYIPSQANFIFHQVKGQDGEYTKAMTAKHVIVGRAFPPISGWNRLTLGTPGEMKAFVTALKAVRKEGLV